MKLKLFLKLTLCHSSLSFTYNRYENRHQLVRFVCQRLQLVSPAKSCSFQQLQPIRCLLKFLHATFYLANEIGVGLGSLCLPKVCSHGGARSQELVTRSFPPHEPCSSSFLAELPRFGNSRNVEMTTSGKFARVSLVLQPVANLLPIRVVPDQVGGAQLGEMPAHGLNRSPGNLGELARR